MVFALRRIQEKCRDKNKGLIITFVDLTKGFDTVSRNGLWKILRKVSCPPKFLAMVNPTTWRSSRPSETQIAWNRAVFLRQRFSLYSLAWCSNMSQRILMTRMAFTFVFVQKRLQAHTKTKEKLVRELLFADDAALVAETAMQRITFCFAEAALLFGL